MHIYIDSFDLLVYQLLIWVTTPVIFTILRFRKAEHCQETDGTNQAGHCLRGFDERLNTHIFSPSTRDGEIEEGMIREDANDELVNDD
jgi:hypothetical protein